MRRRTKFSKRLDFAAPGCHISGDAAASPNRATTIPNRATASPSLASRNRPAHAFKRHHSKLVVASLVTSALSLALALGSGAAAVADEGPDFFEPVTEVSVYIPVADYSDALPHPYPPEVLEHAEEIGAPLFDPPLVTGGISEHIPEPIWQPLEWDIDRGPNWTDRVLLTYDDCMADPDKFIAVLDHATASNIGLLLFPTGNCITMYQNRFGIDLVQAIRERGHWVGNHTITHPYLTRVSRAEVARQIAWPETNILRPPFGDWNQTVYQVAAENGMRLMMWDLDTNDWRGPKPEQDIIDLIVTYAEPGNSVLMHFQHRGFSTHALTQIQSGLRARGIELCRPAQPPPAAYPGADPRQHLLTIAILRKRKP